MRTPPPKLPTMKPRVPQSVEPKRNAKEVELERVRLLKQIVEEAKAFSRPAMRKKRQERQCREK